MARALVMGSGDRVSAVADLLRAEGLDVITGTGPDDLEALADGPPVDYYVQLPVTVRPAGETAVGRVWSFLSGGLLARFALVEQALPRLARGATVVLVSGNTPDGAALPDDERSRFALLHVLAHATRAELQGCGRVTVAAGSRSDPELVGYALRGEEDRTARLLGDPTDQVSGAQYQDWRTEVMGLVQYHG
jgi:hypothetical protein